MISIYKLLKFTMWDILHKKEKKPINGIWVYTGLYGQGKTLSMVLEAYKLHNKGYNIYSNIGMKFQDGSIETWQDVIDVPPNSVICLDEISNLINSRDWKNMPQDFFGLLTQNRKLNIRLMATAQVFDDVDRQFRTLTQYIIRCKKLGRIERNVFYNQIGYNHVDGKKENEFSNTFVLENYMFDLYDTFEYVKKLNSEYKK